MNDSSATKTRLLDTAERLFAEKGIRGASLREITSEAGANLAAINYHFGSKEELLRAIIERHAVPLFRERVTLLERAEEAAGDEPPTVRAIVRAFLTPLFEFEREHPNFPKLLGRVQMENLHTVVGDVFHATFFETLQRFTASSARALPHLHDDEIRWRLLFCVGAFHFMLMKRQLIGEIAGVIPDSKAIEEQLLTFAEAGLQAPSNPSQPRMTPAEAQRHVHSALSDRRDAGVDAATNGEEPTE